jgi:enoyl-CoA hydratase
LTVATRWSGRAFLIGLDRPAHRNALDLSMIEAFHVALDEVSQEPCVVIVHSTSAGIFAAGADLNELLARGADDALRRINVDLFDRLDRHRWPTIAAIDGAAVGGGCELALSCDLRFASPGSRFAQPETSLGVIAGAGGNWRLAEAIGVPAARRMLYLGDSLMSEQALRLGLIDRVADEPLDAAIESANAMAERSMRALELTKLALSLHRRPTTTFDVVAQALCFDSDDKHSRIEAAIRQRSSRRKNA